MIARPLAAVVRAALLLGVLLGALLGALTLATAPAGAAPVETTGRETFTGTLLGSTRVDNRESDLSIAVDAVWSGRIRSEEVTVRVPRQAFAGCDVAADADVVVRAVRRDGRLVAERCWQVRTLTAAETSRLEAEFPDGSRPPVRELGGDDPELSAVTFTCPDTSEALADPSAETGSCDALADQQGLDRALAPGLALVLVGGLGLLVSRRFR